MKLSDGSTNIIPFELNKCDTLVLYNRKKGKEKILLNDLQMNDKVVGIIYIKDVKDNKKKIYQFGKQDLKSLESVDRNLGNMIESLNSKEGIEDFIQQCSFPSFGSDSGGYSFNHFWDLLTKNNLLKSLLGVTGIVRGVTSTSDKEEKTWYQSYLWEQESELNLNIKLKELLKRTDTTTFENDFIYNIDLNKMNTEKPEIKVNLKSQIGYDKLKIFNLFLKDDNDYLLDEKNQINFELLNEESRNKLQSYIKDPTELNEGLYLLVGDVSSVFSPISIPLSSK